MNERIKELAEQSGAGWDDKYHWYVGSETMQKFAELILKECVDICNRVYFDNYPDAEDFERSEEGDAIKKHFGVKV